MTFKSFEEIDAWKKSRELTRRIYEVTALGAFSRDFPLRDQIRRACVSVMSNVAEGHGRGGRREFLQFLSMALGSANEISSQLYVALDQGYISDREFQLLTNLVRETANLIGGLCRYLRTTEVKGRKFKTADLKLETKNQRPKTMNLLVTGGCGFIGSNFIRRRLAGTDDEIINLDALTYAGNLANLQEFEGNARYRFVHGRIEDPAVVKNAMNDVDAVVHFAAESHVDRSIDDAAPFITTNVLGTQVMLDAARKAGVKRFVHVSTDEVYGALGAEGKFTETTPFQPRSPYSASKAAGDLLAQAFWETHKLPVMVVRPSNNYGPYQFPEKLIPVMVTNLVEGRKVPVYGRGENVRDWLHVDDCCRAIDIVLDHGEPGETYNIGGESERRNIDVVRQVISLMGMPVGGPSPSSFVPRPSPVSASALTSTSISTSTSSVREPETKNQELRTNEWITLVPDRPGHDFRYALDNAKIRRELGWQPEVKFEDGLRRTVDWYREHPEWWQPLKARLTRESGGFWTSPSPTKNQ